MNCYDLTMELSKIKSDIENKMNFKMKQTDILNREQIDREIDSLECKKLEIINVLKSKQVY